MQISLLNQDKKPAPANFAPSQAMQVKPENLALLSDSQLYQRAKDYGLHARQWLRKFEGLLPEVARRRLYKRRGCSSIHEFAAKLAGMSHEKTDRILRLAQKLEDKPALKNIFETGTAPYCKLEKVAFIATRETEKAWAEKVMTISQQALTISVEAARNNRLETIACDNFQPEKMPAESLEPVREPLHSLSLKINSQLESKLRLIKQQLEKQRGEALGFAEVLAELVKVYEQTSSEKTATMGSTAPETSALNSSVSSSSASVPRTALRPQKIIQLCPKCIKEKANDMAQFGLITRHIPQEVRDLVSLQQNGACAFPNCMQPPEIFHHTRRFALQKNHDPDYIVYLCVVHERTAHAGLIGNEEEMPKTWRIKTLNRNSPLEESVAAINLNAKSRIDEKVNAHRHEPATMSL